MAAAQNWTAEVGYSASVVQIEKLLLQRILNGVWLLRVIVLVVGIAENTQGARLVAYMRPAEQHRTPATYYNRKQEITRPLGT